MRLVVGVVGLVAGGCPADSTTGDVAVTADATVASDAPDEDTERADAIDTSPTDAEDDARATETREDTTARDTTADAPEVVTPVEAMRLHVLDVGQGEALLVELPCGAMLVDTGGEVTVASGGDPGFDSDEALEAALRAFFAARPDLESTLDLVVLTHPHIDHTRGVTRLLEMVQAGDLVIGNVVTNGAEGSGIGVREQRALHDWADATPGVGRWYVLQRKTGPTGLVNEVIDPFPACARAGGAAVDPKITALWGRVDAESENAATWDEGDLDNDNNHSVVLRVDFGAASLLLTGDLEEAGIAALVAQYGGSGVIDVDVYKAGHHGSHNGTTAALVNAMSPRVAVISSGPADREGDWTAWAHGHPRWRAVSDMLGDADSPGVSDDRPTPIDALVASYYDDGHGVFESRRITPAVYNTGWARAHVVIGLRADGTIELPD